MQTLYSIHFKALGSACELIIAADNESLAMEKMQLAYQEVVRIEHKYSRYRADSVLSLMNRSAGTAWVDCDEETESLLNYANTLYSLSDGLFDITSGILRKAWNFNQAVVPSDAQLSDLLFFVGWQKVERRPGQIRLPLIGMEIDFGGFGKEYAVDRAATILQQAGVTSGFVNLGGDLRVLGQKPDGSPWVMGIQHPRIQDDMICHLQMAQGGLATSGDYERFFEKDGRRYCHVLSPVTGMPVKSWRSVTVIAPLAITAGTYTTITMLKEEQGQKWLDASGYSYLAIDAEGNLYQKAVA